MSSGGSCKIWTCYNWAVGSDKLDIYVFAHWRGMPAPEQVGVLSAHYAKGKKAFSFTYTPSWLKSDQRALLDPDIQFYSGVQFPSNKENFGIFLDSMPDTWGRTLMRLRAVHDVEMVSEKRPIMRETDYLLGVSDEGRMGALRFKLDLNGPFLDDNIAASIPPWSSVRDLQYATEQLETGGENAPLKKWLAILLAPGSSLGGARPKANIRDENGVLWIAKFPSKNDRTDKGAWEYLAYKLALKSGILMAPSRIEKVSGGYHTFFTKRFDREKAERIHFASAMTMTGNNEDTIRDNPASYLNLAEFIQNYCSNIEANLSQLWRRIVFNISISNTDDHMRNHGFLLTDVGWNLSPAYDLNPSIDKDGLALNIDMDNNSLDLNIAKGVGDFFRLNVAQMDAIIAEVSDAIAGWELVAKEIGISRLECEEMKGAFRY